MLTLSEVSKDVALALGLKPVSYSIPSDGVVWYDAQGNMLDGSWVNLTDPYWRCACEDWLIDRGWSFTTTPTYAQTWNEGLKSDILTVCAGWPEAPARLVSAVYRRAQLEARTA